MDSWWDCFIKAKSGCDKSSLKIVENYQSRLTALAMLITGSVEAADDIVQETFIRALNTRLKSTTGSVQGYLGTIAYRLALKESKRTEKNVGLNGLNLHDSSVNPLDNILIKERDKLVARTINTLDTNHRDVLVLRFYADHSYEEIASLLEVPLGTVKSRIFFAVKSCREILREKGVLK